MSTIIPLSISITSIFFHLSYHAPQFTPQYCSVAKRSVVCVDCIQSISFQRSDQARPEAEGGFGRCVGSSWRQQNALSQSGPGPGSDREQTETESESDCGQSAAMQWTAREADDRKPKRHRRTIVRRHQSQNATEHVAQCNERLPGG